MKKQLGSIISLAVILQGMPLLADAPGQIYYRGQLASPDTTYTGNKSITFSIWDSVSGGNQLFTETQPNVPASNGLFTALMGSVTPIAASVFQGGNNRFLEIDVPGETSAARIPMAAAPYAMSVSGINVNNGNVGIGTPASGYTLDVNGGGAATLRLTSTFSDKIHFQGGPANVPHTLVDDSGEGFRFWDATNGQTLLITNTGKVGIGTTSPDQALTVQGVIHTIPSAGWGNSNTAYNYLGDTFNGISAQFGGYTQVFGYWGVQLVQQGNIGVTFTGGKVGIGTTTPNANLQVAGGDVAVSNPGSGVILKATDNSAVCYRVTVNSAGALSTASVACP